MVAPTSPKPAIIIAQVAASGTAVRLAFSGEKSKIRAFSPGSYSEPLAALPRLRERACW